MPISADKMKLYPGGSTHSKEWKSIRSRILDRARHCCEGTPHHPDCEAENYQPHPETGSKVILTIAHMDWDETNNEDTNLRALCQRCHNKWDAPERRKNAARTRRLKSNQIDLEDWLDTRP